MYVFKSTWASPGEGKTKSKLLFFHGSYSEMSSHIMLVVPWKNNTILRAVKATICVWLDITAVLFLPGQLAVPGLGLSPHPPQGLLPSTLWILVYDLHPEKPP